jgi:hypothetical protein
LKVIFAILVLIAIIGITYWVTMHDKTGTLSRETVQGQETEILIGVISDTHVPTRAREVPRKVFEIFEGVNYIIHAGDLVQLQTLRELEEVAPVVAVYGNMDTDEVRERLPKINSIEVYGWKIGVIHDSFAPWKMGKMENIAKENGFDVLIFGHTHRPLVKEGGNILYINPGSPTNPLFTRPSVALLKIRKDNIKAEIIDL